MRHLTNLRVIAGLTLIAATAHISAQVPNLASAAKKNGRMSVASDVEAFSRDVQSIVAMSSNGNTLYEADSNRRNWQNYCGASRSASERGEFRRAVQDASKALHVGGGGTEPVASAFATRDLAIAYSWGGDLGNAKLWAERSLGFANSIGSSSMDVNYQIRFDGLKVLGDVAFRLGEYPKALALYKDAQTKLPWVGAGFNKDFIRDCPLEILSSV